MKAFQLCEENVAKLPIFVSPHYITKPLDRQIEPQRRAYEKLYANEVYWPILALNKITWSSVGARFIAPIADDDFCHSRSVEVCHPEPIRFAQGKLREGSSSMGNEMLRCAQHDKTESASLSYAHDQISTGYLIDHSLEHLALPALLASQAYPALVQVPDSLRNMGRKPSAVPGDVRIWGRAA